MRAFGYGHSRAHLFSEGSGIRFLNFAENRYLVRRPGALTAQQHSRQLHCRHSRSGRDRRQVLHVRASRCRRFDARRRLFSERQTVVGPPSRKGRETPRGAGASLPRILSGYLPERCGYCQPSQGTVVSNHRQDPCAHGTADDGKRCSSEDQAAGQGCQPPFVNVLPHVSGHGHHDVSGKRRHHRKSPARMHPKHRSIPARCRWLESMFPHCWSWPRGANRSLTKITEETHARAQG